MLKEQTKKTKTENGHRVAISNQQTVLSRCVASSLSMSKIVFPARCRKPPHSANLSGETERCKRQCVCVFVFFSYAPFLGKSLARATSVH